MTVFIVIARSASDEAIWPSLPPSLRRVPRRRAAGETAQQLLALLLELGRQAAAEAIEQLLLILGLGLRLARINRHQLREFLVAVGQALPVEVLVVRHQ